MDDPVHIPCSSRRRSQRVYAKLLIKVDPDAENGFGFEGTLLRPGKTIEWAALWPTPEHPRIPVLLECASTENPERGHNRHQCEDLYILWKFDLGRGMWIELARTASASWTWALDLRPIAVRALDDSAGLEVVGFDQVVSRIDQMLDLELRKLPRQDRARAVAVLHDQFCSRMVHLSAA